MAITPYCQLFANYRTTPVRNRFPLHHNLRTGFHLRGDILLEIGLDLTMLSNMHHARSQKNVINHQLKNYIESQGRDPEQLTDTEREAYGQKMIDEYYPGTRVFNRQ